MRSRGAVHAVGRRLRGPGAWLATSVAGAAASLAYRRRELAVLVLLAASLLGGLGVEQWRARAPSTLERLEAEPPRLAAPPRASAARPGRGSTAPRAERRSSAQAVREAPLDLNRATAADLERLPGIGPRLAARILVRREALGGAFRSPEDLATVPGLGRRKAELLSSRVTTGVAPGGGEPPLAPEAPP